MDIKPSLAKSASTRSRIRRDKLRSLVGIAFMLAISETSLAYIYSTFLQELVSASQVGLVFSASYAASFLAIVYAPAAIKRLHRFPSFLVVLTANVLFLVLLATLQSKVLLLLSFGGYIVSLNLVWVMLDIFLEYYSEDSMTGRVRGTVLAVMNLGWVLTPVVAGYLFEVHGFIFMFLAAAALLLPTYAVLGWKLADIGNHEARPRRLVATLRKIVRSKPLRSIFYLAFLLQAFYSVIVIYSPIYLLELGFDFRQIGLMFSLMLIAFVLVEYVAGYLADTYFGEKEILTLGIFIIAGATAFLTVSPTSFGILLATFFMTRVGAALLEVLRDSYFYKHVDASDVNLITLFRNTAPVAYVITPPLASLVVVFVDLRYVFVCLGGFMLTGLIFSLTMPDTK